MLEHIRLSGAPVGYLILKKAQAALSNQTNKTGNRPIICPNEIYGYVCGYYDMALKHDF